jgi:glycosyltransferase involved in cell wall biosynthesis
VGGEIITIGMPVFNAETTISAAIESVVNQSFKNWALVISDNFSTDNSFKICQDFANVDSRIVCVRQESNIGAWPNFWNILNTSTTRYFKFLASDDSLTPNFLKDCIEILENDRAVIGVTADDVYESDQVLRIKTNTFDFMDNLDNRLANFFQNAWVSNGIFYGVFRTENIKNAFLGIENQDFLIKDWLIIARLLFQGKISRIHTSMMILGEAGFGRNPTNWKRQLHSFSDWIFPYRYFSKGISKQSRDLDFVTRIKLAIFLLNLYVNHFKGIVRTSIPFWKIN